MRLSLQRWSKIASCGLAACVLALSACKPKPAASTADASPAPESRLESWLAPLPPTESTPPASASLPPPPPPWSLRKRPLPSADVSAIVARFGRPTTVEGALKEATELLREYQTDTEYLSRVETIYKLADASSPQSRAILSQLFFSEKNLELRVQMVNALPFVDSEDLGLSLPLLQEATKAQQPRELRAAGLDTIHTLNDPRTLPALLPMLNDPDEELRKSAAETVQYYQEVLKLDQR